jgi:small GTP-binding protein
MLIGIIGAPNKGKSTLFSALTLNDVAIADYPFTTINPNMGITYATRECVERELGVRCNARNSLCINGIRKIPVNIVDVAGLVEGAHEGKGMGNQFLNDLASADILLLVVDASGRTDPNGNPCSSSDPSMEVSTVENELIEWISSIIKKHMGMLSKRMDGSTALAEVLTGLKISKEQIKAALEKTMLPQVKINWPDKDTNSFSSEILKQSKPFIIVANKIDVKGSAENLRLLQSKFGKTVIGCSAAIELGIKRAERKGIIEFTGLNDFRINEAIATKEQIAGLDYALKFLRNNGSNVQEIINTAVFGVLNNIVVYPVEDENRYKDHFGNVLPDAILIRQGSTALDLAAVIHTDIAKNMLYAIDARTKKRLAKDYVLKDNDVIRIVSAAK